MKLLCLIFCLLNKHSLESSKDVSFENKLSDIVRKYANNSKEILDYDTNVDFQKLMAEYSLLDRLRFLKKKFKYLLKSVQDMTQPLKPEAITMLQDIVKEMEPQFTGGNIDDNSLRAAFNFTDRQVEEFHDYYADAKVLLFRLNSAMNKRIKIDTKS
uniref:Uncharacterized protein n=1 Tax=Clastoptera arizonana TaxID=38151 RepID=A0A1B6CKQ8_9HEMI